MKNKTKRMILVTMLMLLATVVASCATGDTSVAQKDPNSPSLSLQETFRIESESALVGGTYIYKVYDADENKMIYITKSWGDGTTSINVIDLPYRGGKQ